MKPNQKASKPPKILRLREDIADRCRQEKLTLLKAESKFLLEAGQANVQDKEKLKLIGIGRHSFQYVTQNNIPLTWKTFRAACLLIGHYFNWKLRYLDFCQCPAALNYLDRCATKVARVFPITDGEAVDKDQPKSLGKYLSGLTQNERAKRAADFRAFEVQLELLSSPLVELGDDETDWTVEGEVGERVAVSENASNSKELLERIDLALKRYCQFKIDEWDEHWTGKSNFGQDKRLAFYVPPRFSLLKAQYARRAGSLSTPTARPSLSGEGDAYDPVPGVREEDRLKNLLSLGGDRLCVSEGPGAGKTIFTHRLAAYLSTEEAQLDLFQSRRMLVVRREESDLDGSWPDDFEKEVEAAISPFCKVDNSKRHPHPSEIANCLLRLGRVIFILDAMDQASANRVQVFDKFLVKLNTNQWTCRLVLTGRPFATETLKARCKSPWRFARMEPLDPAEQYLYLRGPSEPKPNETEAWRKRACVIAPSQRLLSPLGNFFDPIPPDESPDFEPYVIQLRKLFPDYDALKYLVGNPNALYLIRGLAEAGQLPEFRNAADLYYETSRGLLKSGFENFHKRKPTDAEWMKLEQLLSATACEQMVRIPESHVVEGADRIESLREAVARRVTNLLCESDWKQLENCTVWSNRTLLRVTNSACIAWPDRRMMEFYCGLHLVKNEQPHWLSRTSVTVHTPIGAAK